MVASMTSVVQVTDQRARAFLEDADWDLDLALAMAMSLDDLSDAAPSPPRGGGGSGALSGGAASAPRDAAAEAAPAVGAATARTETGGDAAAADSAVAHAPGSAADDAASARATAAADGAASDDAATAAAAPASPTREERAAAELELKRSIQLFRESLTAPVDDAMPTGESFSAALKALVREHIDFIGDDDAAVAQIDNIVHEIESAEAALAAASGGEEGDATASVNLDTHVVAEAEEEEDQEQEEQQQRVKKPEYGDERAHSKGWTIASLGDRVALVDQGGCSSCLLSVVFSLFSHALLFHPLLLICCRSRRSRRLLPNGALPPRTARARCGRKADAERREERRRPHGRDPPPLSAHDAALRLLRPGAPARRRDAPPQKLQRAPRLVAATRGVCSRRGRRRRLDAPRAGPGPLVIYVVLFFFVLLVYSSIILFASASFVAQSADGGAAAKVSAGDAGDGAAATLAALVRRLDAIVGAIVDEPDAMQRRILEGAAFAAKVLAHPKGAPLLAALGFRARESDPTEGAAEGAASPPPPWELLGELSAQCIAALVACRAAFAVAQNASPLSALAASGGDGDGATTGGARDPQTMEEVLAFYGSEADALLAAAELKRFEATGYSSTGVGAAVAAAGTEEGEATATTAAEEEAAAKAKAERAALMLLEPAAIKERLAAVGTKADLIHRCVDKSELVALLIKVRATERAPEALPPPHTASRYCVLLSLAEAESLRRAILSHAATKRADGDDARGAAWGVASVALSTSEGTWLTDSYAETHLAAELAPPKEAASSSAVASHGSAAHVVATSSNASALSEERVIALVGAKFKEARAEGAAPNPAAAAALDHATNVLSLELAAAAAATKRSSLSFDAARQCARFFDCRMQFDDDALILVLSAMRGAPESERRRAYEELMMSRRRDRVEWSGAPVAEVFAHATEKNLIRLRDFAARVRRSISAKQLTLQSAFEACQARGSGGAGGDASYLARSDLVHGALFSFRLVAHLFFCLLIYSFGRPARRLPRVAAADGGRGRGALPAR